MNVNLVVYFLFQCRHRFDLYSSSCLLSTKLLFTSPKIYAFFSGGQGRVVVGGFVGGVWNAGCKSVHFSIGKVTKIKRDKRDVTLLTTR